MRYRTCRCPIIILRRTIKIPLSCFFHKINCFFHKILSFKLIIKNLKQSHKKKKCGGCRIRTYEPIMVAALAKRWFKPLTQTSKVLRRLDSNQGFPSYEHGEIVHFSTARYLVANLYPLPRDNPSRWIPTILTVWHD